MAKLAIKKATTDVTLYVFIQDSSVTTGAGKTGLVFNSAGLVCYYVRPLAAAAALTLATQTVTGAHSDGGFVEVDATNMPGVYRLDLSDAICATGVNSVVVMLKGATNMAPCLIEIQLVSYDPNDTVRLGMTALPNAAAEAAGGLYTRGSGAGQINQAANGQVDANAVAISGDSVAADNLETASDGGSYNLGGGGVVAASVTGAVGSVASGGIAAASFAAGAIDATAIAANAIGAAELATDAVAEIADAIWDEARSGHTTDGTFGQAAQIVRSGTAQAGAAGTITLDSGASAVDDFYNNQILFLVGGTGLGQSRIVSDYVGSTKVATVNGNWATNPDVTSVFMLFPFGSIPGATAPTAGEVADAVWDEATAGHTTAGTFGEQVKTDVDAILADTDSLDTTKITSARATNLDNLDAAVSTRSTTGDAMALTSAERNSTADIILARSLAAEAYAADGAVPTLSQMLYMMWSAIGDFAISGTTLTCKKLDGSTTAMTFTLDSATAPTSRTRAT